MGLSPLASPSQVWLVFGAGGNEGPQIGRDPNELCPLYPASSTEIYFLLPIPREVLWAKFGRVVKTLGPAIKQMCIQNLALLRARQTTEPLWFSVSS